MAEPAYLVPSFLLLFLHTERAHTVFTAYAQYFYISPIL